MIASDNSNSHKGFYPAINTEVTWGTWLGGCSRMNLNWAYNFSAELKVLCHLRPTNIERGITARIKHCK